VQLENGAKPYRFGLPTSWKVWPSSTSGLVCAAIQAAASAMNSTPTSPYNAVGGFINKRFRMRGVDLTVTHERAIDEVYAHGVVIRASDAAKKWLAPGCCGGVDIQKLLRC